jgi:hypothetical protein
MNYLKERVAYLKNLSKAIKLDRSTDQGKLIEAILEVMDDIVQTVEEVLEAQKDINDQIDILDEDITEIERAIFDTSDEDSIGELVCPQCNKKVAVNADMFDAEDVSIFCPYCNKEIQLEWEEVAEYEEEGDGSDEEYMYGDDDITN